MIALPGGRVLLGDDHAVGVMRGLKAPPAETAPVMGAHNALLRMPVAFWIMSGLLSDAGYSEKHYRLARGPVKAPDAPGAWGADSGQQEA